MPAIAFRNVTKTFEGAGQHPSVYDVTLDVEQGEFVVLLGLSGAGKTTLMRMVNRLIEPTAGEIFVNGTEVRQIHATELRRHIGYVIQQVGLFPHMTVGQNIAVVPRLLDWPRSRIEARTRELLEMVDLAPDRFLKRYPRQLSGGQQQRVGIARAIAADPAVMLMDEPFGALDAITRADLQNELLKIQRKVSKTVMFVTHDVEEALRLADRIAVMRDGSVVQYDTPLTLLTHPADDFVRTLLNADDVFRQLSLIPAESLMTRTEGASASGPTISAGVNVRDALSELISQGAGELTLVSPDNRPVGTLSLERILAAARNGTAAVPSGT